MMNRLTGRKVLFTGMLVFILSFSNLFAAATYAAKPDKTPPTPPKNLHAVLITDTSAALAWTASSIRLV